MVNKKGEGGEIPSWILGVGLVILAGIIIYGIYSYVGDTITTTLENVGGKGLESAIAVCQGVLTVSGSEFASQIVVQQYCAVPKVIADNVWATCDQLSKAKKIDFKAPFTCESADLNQINVDFCKEHAKDSNFKNLVINNARCQTFSCASLGGNYPTAGSACSNSLKKVTTGVTSNGPSETCCI
ncbi:MAG: hypothetical protein AABX66_00515 [Nanoarchaeota archaeon]